MGDVEWQNASDFPQSLPSLFFFFHAAILKQHERQRERAHLQLNLILHRQKSKIVHVKKDRKELLWETKTFSHYVTKEENSAGATLANPNGKASNCISDSKL